MSLSIDATQRAWPVRAPWRLRRPRIGQETLAVLASAYFSIACNGPFWNAAPVQQALQGPGGTGLAVALFVAMTALTTLLLCLVFTRRTAKPVLAIVLAITALAAYFSARYSVYIDADMIRNVLHTDGKEGGELFTASLLGWWVLLGGIPIALLWSIRLEARPIRRAIALRAGTSLGAAAIAALAIGLTFQPLASLMRTHHDVRFMIAPGNWIVSLATVAMEDGRAPHGPKSPVGQDATIAPRAPGSRPRLLVIVVGETVRARNWGLNGYARQTTPQLQRINPFNFRDVTACGTATEVSVPCMFSPYGRAHYDKRKIAHSESLLHVLARAGIDVRWRDNQTGCKGVCDGLPFVSFEHGSDPELCDRDGCRDQAMLREMVDAADASRDQVLVLHQLGNHGPSYFQRYPASLARFEPACTSPDLALCTQATITNAYDNAILNTDDLLATAIARLAAMDDRDTALVYVSDHGESLGENGLYLHGIPYAIAPDTQKKVPMVVWLSPGMVADRGIDMACLRQRATRPASHDNLFHSVLGLMQVRTQVYARGLDVFSSCTHAP